MKNSYCIQSDVNYNYSPEVQVPSKALEVSKAKLRVLNQNISNSLQASNREQITMKKNPCDIQSLKSSCLASESNLFNSQQEQTELKVKSFAIVNHESAKIKRISPETLKNGVYVTQKYQNTVKKLKQDNSSKSHTLKQNKTSCINQNEQKHTKKCQSMANLNIKSKRKSKQKGSSQSPINRQKKQKNQKRSMVEVIQANKASKLKDLIEKSEQREKNIQQQRSAMKEQLSKLKKKHENWLQNINQRIRFENAARTRKSDQVIKWPWGSNEQRIRDLFGKLTEQKDQHFQAKEKKSVSREKRRNELGLRFLHSLNQEQIEKMIKKQSEKKKEGKEFPVALQKERQPSSYIQEFIHLKRQDFFFNQFQNALFNQLQKKQKMDNLQKLEQEVKTIFKRNKRKKNFKLEDQLKNQEKSRNHVQNNLQQNIQEEYEFLHQQYRQLMNQQYMNSMGSSNSNRTDQTKREELKQRYDALRKRFERGVSVGSGRSGQVVYLHNRAASVIQNAWRVFLQKKRKGIKAKKKSCVEEEEEKKKSDDVSLHAPRMESTSAFQSVSKDELMKTVLDELARLDDRQLEQFQKLLSSFKQSSPERVVEAVARREQQSREHFAEKIVQSEFDFNKSRGAGGGLPSPNRHQQSQLLFSAGLKGSSVSQHSGSKASSSHRQIEDIYRIRESVRQSCQLRKLEELVRARQLSPRSFEVKRNAVETWCRKELEELQKLRESLERGQAEIAKALRRAKRDITYASRLARSEVNLQVSEVSAATQEASDGSLHLLVAISQNEFDTNLYGGVGGGKQILRDQSDFQFSVPNSPKVVGEVKSNDQTTPEQLVRKERRRQLSILTSEQGCSPGGRQIQVSPVSNEEKKKRWGGVSVESVVQQVLDAVVEECALELGTRWLGVLQQREGGGGGIQTNLGVVNEYLVGLGRFLKGMLLERWLMRFVGRMNSAFGLVPVLRLRQIHGYDPFVDIQFENQREWMKMVQSRQYALEEEWFVEFESMLGGGNNDDQDDQGVRQWEHLHNKAIFDSLNDTLNSFRPFFTVNGVPFPWSCSEKHLTVIVFTPLNIDALLDKARQKVLEHASLLCGLLSDDDEDDALLRTIDPPPPPSKDDEQPAYMQAIQAIQQQENDYVGQIREERLQKMLLQEINESEFRWFLNDDEKAEILMEVTDFIFEELIEQLVLECFVPK